MPPMESSTVVAGTSKPTFSMACTSDWRLVPAAAFTSARSVARFTATCSTPCTLRRAASTRPTQEAQVMPSMGREMSMLPAVGLLGPDVMVGSLGELQITDSINLPMMGRSSTATENKETRQLTPVGCEAAGYFEAFSQKAILLRWPL